MSDDLDYDKNNAWHVYPSDEAHIHKLEGIDCPCNPKLEKQENNGLVVIHNSADGREYQEEDYGRKSN